MEGHVRGPTFSSTLQSLIFFMSSNWVAEKRSGGDTGDWVEDQQKTEGLPDNTTWEMTAGT
jgi:hypothetical protein